MKKINYRQKDDTTVLIRLCCFHKSLDAKIDFKNNEFD